MPDFERLPLFPLHTVLFPGVSLPLSIFEPRYRLMLSRCIERKEPFGIVLLQEGSEDARSGEQELVLSSVGTTARVIRCERCADSTYSIEVVGETRFHIDETFDDEPYVCAQVKPFWEVCGDPIRLQHLFDLVGALFREYVSALLAGTSRRLSHLQLPQEPELLSFAVAAVLDISLLEKQAMLEIYHTEDRLGRQVEILQRELAGQKRQDTVAIGETQKREKRRSEAVADQAIDRPYDPSTFRPYLSRN